MSYQLTLCGFAASNYYNKVKFALLSKGVAFAEEKAYPYKNEATLARTPMGKIPYLLVNGTPVSESQAIIEFLEEAFPEPRLYPKDLVERAKCRELIQIVELYLELQARRLYSAAFFGGSMSEETKREVDVNLTRGVKALARVAKFAPFIGGGELTYADCAAVFHLPVVQFAARNVLQREVFAEVNALPGYLKHVRAQPGMAQVLADRDANAPEFLEYRTAVEKAAPA